MQVLYFELFFPFSRASNMLKLFLHHLKTIFMNSLSDTIINRYTFTLNSLYIDLVYFKVSFQKKIKTFLKYIIKDFKKYFFS